MIVYQDIFSSTVGGSFGYQPEGSPCGGIRAQAVYRLTSAVSWWVSSYSLKHVPRVPSSGYDEYKQEKHGSALQLPVNVYEDTHILLLLVSVDFI